MSLWNSVYNFVSAPLESVKGYVTGSFTKRVSRHFLNTFQGEYLETPITSHMIDDQSSSKSLKVHQLSLNVGKQNQQLGVSPFLITKMSIGELEVHTPLQDWDNQKQKVQVRGIYVTLRMLNSGEQSAATRAYVQAKQLSKSVHAKLDAEKAKLGELEADDESAPHHEDDENTEEGPSKASLRVFLELLGGIMNNTEISIQDVKLTVEWQVDPTDQGKVHPLVSVMELSCRELSAKSSLRTEEDQVSCDIDLRVDETSVRLGTQKAFSSQTSRNMISYFLTTHAHLLPTPIVKEDIFYLEKHPFPSLGSEKRRISSKKLSILDIQDTIYTSLDMDLLNQSLDPILQSGSLYTCVPVYECIPCNTTCLGKDMTCVTCGEEVTPIRAILHTIVQSIQSIRLVYSIDAVDEKEMCIADTHLVTNQHILLEQGGSTHLLEYLNTGFACDRKFVLAPESKVQLTVGKIDMLLSPNALAILSSCSISSQDPFPTPQPTIQYNQDSVYVLVDIQSARVCVTTQDQRKPQIVDKKACTVQPLPSQRTWSNMYQYLYTQRAGFIHEASSTEDNTALTECSSKHRWPANIFALQAPEVRQDAFVHAKNVGHFFLICLHSTTVQTYVASHGTKTVVAMQLIEMLEGSPVVWKKASKEPTPSVQNMTGEYTHSIQTIGSIASLSQYKALKMTITSCTHASTNVTIRQNGVVTPSVRTSVCNEITQHVENQLKLVPSIDTYQDHADSSIPIMLVPSATSLVITETSEQDYEPLALYASTSSVPVALLPCADTLVLRGKHDTLDLLASRMLIAFDQVDLHMDLGFLDRIETLIYSLSEPRRFLCGKGIILNDVNGANTTPTSSPTKPKGAPKTKTHSTKQITTNPVTQMFISWTQLKMNLYSPTPYVSDVVQSEKNLCIPLCIKPKFVEECMQLSSKQGHVTLSQHTNLQDYVVQSLRYTAYPEMQRGILEIIDAALNPQKELDPPKSVSIRDVLKEDYYTQQTSRRPFASKKHHQLLYNTNYDDLQLLRTKFQLPSQVQAAVGQNVSDYEGAVHTMLVALAGMPTSKISVVLPYLDIVLEYQQNTQVIRKTILSVTPVIPMHLSMYQGKQQLQITKVPQELAQSKQGLQSLPYSTVTVHMCAPIETLSKYNMDQETLLLATETAAPVNTQDLVKSLLDVPFVTTENEEHSATPNHTHPLVRLLLSVFQHPLSAAVTAASKRDCSSNDIISLLPSQLPVLADTGPCISSTIEMGDRKDPIHRPKDIVSTALNLQDGTVDVPMKALEVTPLCEQLAQQQAQVNVNIDIQTMRFDVSSSELATLTEFTSNLSARYTSVGVFLQLEYPEMEEHVVTVLSNETDEKVIIKEGERALEKDVYIDMLLDADSAMSKIMTPHPDFQLSEQKNLTEFVNLRDIELVAARLGYDLTDGSTRRYTLFPEYMRNVYGQPMHLTGFYHNISKMKVCFDTYNPIRVPLSVVHSFMYNDSSRLPQLCVLKLMEKVFDEFQLEETRFSSPMDITSASKRQRRRLARGLKAALEEKDPVEPEYTDEIELAVQYDTQALVDSVKLEFGISQPHASWWWLAVLSNVYLYTDSAYPLEHDRSACTYYISTTALPADYNLHLIQYSQYARNPSTVMKLAHIVTLVLSQYIRDIRNKSVLSNTVETVLESIITKDRSALYTYSTSALLHSGEVHYFVPLFGQKDNSKIIEFFYSMLSACSLMETMSTVKVYNACKYEHPKLFDCSCFCVDCGYLIEDGSDSDDDLFHTAVEKTVRKTQREADVKLSKQDVTQFLSNAHQASMEEASFSYKPSYLKSNNTEAELFHTQLQEHNRSTVSQYDTDSELSDYEEDDNNNNNTVTIVAQPMLPDSTPMTPSSSNSRNSMLVLERPALVHTRMQSRAKVDNLRKVAYTVTVTCTNLDLLFHPDETSAEQRSIMVSGQDMRVFVQPCVHNSQNSIESTVKMPNMSKPMETAFSAYKQAWKSQASDQPVRISIAGSNIDAFEYEHNEYMSIDKSDPDRWVVGMVSRQRMLAAKSRQVLGSTLEQKLKQSLHGTQEWQSPNLYITVVLPKLFVPIVYNDQPSQLDGSLTNVHVLLQNTTLAMDIRDLWLTRASGLVTATTHVAGFKALGKMQSTDFNNDIGNSILTLKQSKQQVIHGKPAWFWKPSFLQVQVHARKCLLDLSLPPTCNADGVVLHTPVRPVLAISSMNVEVSQACSAVLQVHASASAQFFISPSAYTPTFLPRTEPMHPIFAYLGATPETDAVPQTFKDVMALQKAKKLRSLPGQGLFSIPHNYAKGKWTFLRPKPRLVEVPTYINFNVSQYLLDQGYSPIAELVGASLSVTTEAQGNEATTFNSAFFTDMKENWRQRYHTAINVRNNIRVGFLNPTSILTPLPVSIDIERALYKLYLEHVENEVDAVVTSLHNTYKKVMNEVNSVSFSHMRPLQLTPPLESHAKLDTVYYMQHPALEATDINIPPYLLGMLISPSQLMHTTLPSISDISQADDQYDYRSSSTSVKVHVGSLTGDLCLDSCFALQHWVQMATAVLKPVVVPVDNQEAVHSVPKTKPNLLVMPPTPTMLSINSPIFDHSMLRRHSITSDELTDQFWSSPKIVPRESVFASSKAVISANMHNTMEAVNHDYFQALREDGDEWCLLDAENAPPVITKHRGKDLFEDSDEDIVTPNLPNAQGRVVRPDKLALRTLTDLSKVQNLPKVVQTQTNVITVQRPEESEKGKFAIIPEYFPHQSATYELPQHSMRAVPSVAVASHPPLIFGLYVSIGRVDVSIHAGLDHAGNLARKYHNTQLSPYFNDNYKTRQLLPLEFADRTEVPVTTQWPGMTESEALINAFQLPVSSLRGMTIFALTSSGVTVSTNTYDAKCTMEEIKDFIVTREETTGPSAVKSSLSVCLGAVRLVDALPESPFAEILAPLDPHPSIPLHKSNDIRVDMVTKDQLHETDIYVDLPVLKLNVHQSVERQQLQVLQVVQLKPSYPYSLHLHDVYSRDVVLAPAPAQAEGRLGIVHLEPLIVCVDYITEGANYNQLINGSLSELLHLVSLQGLVLEIPEIRIDSVGAWADLGPALLQKLSEGLDKWASGGRVMGATGTIAGLRDILNGCSQQFYDPLRGSSLVTSGALRVLQSSFVLFGDILDAGAQLVRDVEDDFALIETGDEDSFVRVVTEGGRSHLVKLRQQESTILLNNPGHGPRAALVHLRNGVARALQAVFVIPRKKQTLSQSTAALIKGIPALVLEPVTGTVKAVGVLLGSAFDSLDSSVYKPKRKVR